MGNLVLNHNDTQVGRLVQPQQYSVLPLHGGGGSGGGSGGGMAHGGGGGGGPRMVSGTGLEEHSFDTVPSVTMQAGAGAASASSSGAETIAGT